MVCLVSAYYFDMNQTIIDYYDDTTGLASALDQFLADVVNNESTEDADLFTQTITVAKASSVFWNQGTGIPMPMQGPIFGAIVADAGGAIEGGIYGSVAGPLGTVVVGLSGALISSCSGYLFDRIFNF